MRSFVQSHRISLLLRATSLSIIGGVVAGCSSGFSRFDTSVYDSVNPQQAAATNPYPGSIDQTTTASAGGIRPVADVAPQAVPQAMYHAPEPTAVAPRQPYGQPAYVQPQPAYVPPQPTYVQPQPSYQQPRQPLNTYQPQAYSPPKNSSAPSWGAGVQVKRTDLSKPIAAAQKPQSSYQPPKPDKITTASVRSVAGATQSLAGPAVVSDTAQRAAGWSTVGATRIVVRNGETLYNISKRYGVPVQELVKANGLSSADGLQVGQQLLIPSYIFSSTSPVSAPDNNPVTRASRASTGFVGEANAGSVSVPTRRPYDTAALNQPYPGDLPEITKSRYNPKQTVGTPDYQTPDYGIKTGSVGAVASSLYVVKSGDSLSKIAKQRGVSVAQLQAANNISGNVIRIGQRLTIPNSSLDYTSTASVVTDGNYGIDPTITGSTAPAKKIVKPIAQQQQLANLDKTPAPARTGISEFRWPVNGRVVSSFGDKTSNGRNDGIDITVPEGTAVRAAENGVVIYTGDEITMYGKLVLIRHADGWVSAYAHNRQFDVKKGDTVRRGQIIARSGRTGEADRPKVHFELRKNSNPVDPRNYLSGA